MKILMAGDTHGDHGHFSFLIDTAVESEIPVILQVGDFGFLWRDDRALKRLDLDAEEHGIQIWWLDGNHENFYMMGARGCDPNNKSDTWITPNIRYLPRGFRFEVDGTRFMAFGGAVSVDREGPHRIPGRTWFHEETIKTEQVDAVSSDPIDILVSHDAPSGVPALDEFLSRPSRWPESALRDSEWNRKLLAEVADLVKPKLIVHGHYHTRYDDERNGALVVGLDCNSTFARSALVVDTEAYRG